jgi:hypothetical protein
MYFKLAKQVSDDRYSLRVVKNNKHTHGPCDTWFATWMDKSVRLVKIMIKQVIVVVQKGTELVEKSSVLCFAFMVTEVNGKISLEVFDDLLVISSLKNRSPLVDPNL